jgi:hypothetical protein
MYQLKGYFRVPNLSLKDQDAKDVVAVPSTLILMSRPKDSKPMEVDLELDNSCSMQEFHIKKKYQEMIETLIKVIV